MPKSSNANVFRMPVTVSEEIYAYLSQLSIKSKATGGLELPSAMITRAALRALMETDLDVSGVRSEEELVGRVKEAFSPSSPGRIL